MLTTVGLKASDGADVDYGRDYNPYVTLPSGWLFGGKTKYDYHWFGHNTTVISAVDDEKSVGSDKNFRDACFGTAVSVSVLCVFP